MAQMVFSSTSEAFTLTAPPESYGNRLLISWLSFFQSLCLLFEWVGTIYTALYTPTVIRSVCFHLICIYVFVHCMQTGLLATIAVDLLISIVCPLLHRVSRNGLYVAIMSLPSTVYGLLSVALGFVLSDDNIIVMCNPPSSLQKRANEFWYGVAFAAGAVTIISYLLAYFILFHKNQQQELARRSMRSLSIILLIFLLTRYTATIGANVMNMVNADPSVVTLFQNYCIIANISGISR
ncbi:unnamed protein product [Cylicocyclus nassatus]|uniref:Uncharacterized protein n=1 Tax=Cylicocyclus nassatus TaxID=53992 RepID=A0AA36H310_CYLNA|nr:unnamed protein product [Cylicocyclus nassatus]